MPIGRPPKFRNNEEKTSVRREQIRKNVQAFRKRKSEKLRQQQEAQVTQWSQVLVVYQNTDSNESYEPMTDRLRRCHSPFDIGELSDQPQVELSFGFLPAIIQDFELATSRYPWALAQNSLRCKDSFLDKAILAGGARVLSSMYNYDGLLRISRMAYQETLVLTRSRLKNLRKSDVLPMICAMTALANFEVADGSSRTKGSKWSVHTSAILNMIRAAGPRTFQSPLGLGLLRGQRYTAIVMAMWDSSNNFLDAEEWQTVPFLIEGKIKEDELWDITFDLPQLNSLLQNLIGQFRGELKQEDKFKIADDLHRGLLDISKRLEQWATEFRGVSTTTLHSKVRYTPVSPWFRKYLPETIPLSLDLSLQFDSLLQAESYVRLWTVQFQVYEAAEAAYGLLSRAGHADHAARFKQNFLELQTNGHRQLALSDGGTFGQMSLNQDSHDPEALVLNICRSMEFSLGEDPRDLRGAIICGNVPFQVAARYLSRWPSYYAAEIRWCDAVAEVLSRRCLLSGKPLNVLTDIK